jgi:hypothetical protein
MVDNDFLNQYGIKPEDVPSIQKEIMNSVKKKEFTELNKKYNSNIIEHLCNDLVSQGKLGRTAKATSSGLVFPYQLI